MTNEETATYREMLFLPYRRRDTWIAILAALGVGMVGYEVEAIIFLLVYSMFVAKQELDSLGESTIQEGSEPMTMTDSGEQYYKKTRSDDPWWYPWLLGALRAGSVALLLGILWVVL